jgi:hypothetical protein
LLLSHATKIRGSSPAARNNFPRENTPPKQDLQWYDAYKSLAENQEDLAQGTLGIGKTGDGLEALKLWREKRLMELAETTRPPAGECAAAAHSAETPSTL